MPSVDAASNICPNIAPLPLSPSASPDATLPFGPEDQEMCACFADQTDSLNRLYSLHRSVQSRARSNGSPLPGDLCRLDICIQRINTALDSSKAFLSCTRCSKESCSVLLTVSSLQLVMRLYEYVVADIQCTGGAASFRDKMVSTLDRSSDDQLHMSCRLGDYEVSPEESIAIRRLVVRRALQKGRETLSALKMLSMGGDYRVEDGSSPSSTSSWKSSSTRVTETVAGTKSQDGVLPEHALTAADVAYLQQVVCRGDAVLDVFLRTVCPL